MENKKILVQIRKELELALKQTENINAEDTIHRIDIDVLQNKLRNIYEQLFEINQHLDKKDFVEEEIEIPAIPFVEKEAERVEIRETLVDEIHEQEIVAEEEEMEPEEIIPEPEIILTPVVEIEEEIEPQFLEKEKPKEVVFETTNSSLFVEEVKKEEARAVRSTIDLFSDASEKTISDKFSHEKEPTIADRMRQTRIADLRQAIGINEKFLFINELFNGDLSKYNKALDELNDMKSREGIDSYFIELMVHNQWNEENDALIKLKEILDRKFE